MEKVVIISSGAIKNSNGKDWIELTDADGKAHRVFQSIQGENDEWVHLENEISMLKAKIEDGSITNLPLKLKKEKKGQYWNVVGVELVKDGIERQAIEKVRVEMGDSKNRAFALSYSKDVTVARIAQGKDEDYIQIIIRADSFCSYLDSGNIPTKEP